MTTQHAYETKISRPEIARVSYRSRLVRTLQPTPGCSAIFISAPAGYGKSTLLASYVENSAQTCLWYRVDASDADPATFFYYLGLSAQQVTAGTKVPLPLLTADHLPSLGHFSRTFFSTLFADLGPSACLVIDDYHQLPDDSLLHGLIVDTLAQLPPTIQLIMASRHPPPPVFARLIANRCLHVVERNEIKLTAPECRDILALHGLPLPEPERLELLLGITDGWPAGLTLLIQSGALERLEQTAAGHESGGMMFDYFANEVLKQLDDDTQVFLLKTCLLTQMSPVNSERLTGNAQAAAILAELTARNYFTYRRQDSYEYHTLFRGFLRDRVRRAYPPEQLRSLKHRAAAIEQAEQRFEAAVELYARAGDLDALESLILEHAATLVSQGRFVTLQGWIEQMPVPRRDASPWLRYWFAQCRLPFDSAAALGNFEAAFDGFQGGDDPRGLLLAWCGAVDTFVYRWDRFYPLDRWIAWMDGWLEQDGEFPDELIEGYVACAMANALFYRQSNRVGEIGQWLERAWAIAQHCDDPMLLVQAGFSYIGWNTRIGAFKHSNALLAILLQRVDVNRISPMLKIMFKIHQTLGMFLGRDVENDHLTPLKEGLALADSADIHLMDALLYCYTAYDALIFGDVERAAAMLQRMEAANRAAPHLLHQSHYLYVRGWEHFVRRDFTLSAEYCRASLAMAQESGCLFALCFPRTGLAQALFDQGQKAQAHREIEQALRDCRAMGSPLLEFHALMARAYFELADGIDDEALEALRTGLSLGRRHDFVLSALWWHHPMVEKLCTAALDAGIEPDFVIAFLRSRRFVPENPPVACRNWPWPLKIHCFGGFEILKDGEALTFGRKTPKKPLELLKAVISLGGTDVPENRLIDELWPDSDGDIGRSAFSTTVKRLRQLIGAEALSVGDGRVSLDRRRCWTDVWAFENEIDQAEVAARSGDSETFMICAEEAVAFYHGHFLAADQDAWALATRERLRNRLLGLLGKAGGRFEGDAQWRLAVDWYRRGLELDPLAEEFYQGLMRAYLNLGCRAEGVRTYRACQTALSQGFGIQTSPATETLFRKLTDN